MTEVTSIRTHSAGMIYPLKDIHDNFTYLRKPQYDPRVTNSASAAMRGDNSPRKFKDMREGFQQAALINIVASVNNEHKPKPMSASHAENTLNVLSNLFLHRDRQISIPKPQVFMEEPQKFSKKKPLFNKKSCNQVTEKEIESRKKILSLSRARPFSRDTETPKQESIKIAVSLQRNSDDSCSTDDGWISSPSKVRLARSNSPRHRQVSLKKKTEQRVPTSISTCEAIDILDATENFTQIKPSSVSAIREHITSSNHDANLYRAKSLPALFPVKRRRTDTPNGTSGEKKQNANPFKKTPVKTYGGMPNLVVGKPFQGKSTEETENSDESSKPASQQSNKSSEVQTKVQPKDAKDDKVKERFINPENITLHGRSIQNPRNTSSQSSRYSKHPETDLLYSALEDVDEKRLIVKNLDKQFEDLRKSISAKMSTMSDGGSVFSDTSTDFASYNLVGKGIKSNLSSTSSAGKNKLKSQKRVTFAEDTEQNSVVGEKLIHSYDNERALLNARLMQTKYHYKEKDRDDHKMKPISDTELVRLKQKLLPGVSSQDDSKNKTSRDFLDNIRISGMLAPTARSSSRASDTNRSMVSEADTIAVEEAAREWNGVDIDATNRDRTEIPLSQGASSFYPTTQDEDLESDESEENIEQYIDSYRVVKAIDLGKLSNYQHRKFKKASHKHDPSTTHFVKIKVK